MSEHSSKREGIGAAGCRAPEHPLAQLLHLPVMHHLHGLDSLMFIPDGLKRQQVTDWWSMPWYMPMVDGDAFFFFIRRRQKLIATLPPLYSRAPI